MNQRKWAAERGHAVVKEDYKANDEIRKEQWRIQNSQGNQKTSKANRNE